MPTNLPTMQLIQSLILVGAVAVVIVSLSSFKVVYAKHLRVQEDDNRRELVASYYHTLSASTLGGENPDAAVGNPLKGLMESPIYTNPPYKFDIPLAVEFYYVGTYLCKVIVSDI